MVDQVKAGSAEAWNQFTLLYGPLINYWCHQAGLRPEDADDVQQSVLLAVSRNIGRLSTSREEDSLRGWLRTITTNRIRDHFRAASRHADRAVGGTEFARKLQEVPDEGDLEFQFTQQDEDDVLLRQVIEGARSEFESKTWQAFWLTAVEGQLAADVASQLGMTVGAVYKAKSRVLRALRVKAEFHGLERLGLKLQDPAS